MNIYSIRDNLLELVDEMDALIIELDTIKADAYEQQVDEQTPKINRNRWSEDEIDFIYVAVNNEQYPVSKIAEMLKRTESSIVAKAHNLNLNTKNGLIIIKREIA